MTPTTTHSRFFQRKQRFALLAAAHGRCQACGIVLPDGFHADHIIPVFHGGKTDVLNGQVLCPTCNLKKGAVLPIDDAMMIPVTKEPVISSAHAPLTTPVSAAADLETDHVSSDLQLHPWQRQGVAQWIARCAQGQRDMTVVACPGAGKTRLAIHLAHHELLSGRCDFVVIVCPSRQLKMQWARAAQQADLTLTAGWGNGAAAPPRDVVGVVITYGQLARLPEAERLLCGRHRVFAAMDEIHHGAHGLAWGDGLREAFECADARLCLSGTPFRTDGLRLPFVDYDCSGRVVGNVRYDYTDALADGVVRPIYFHAYDGRLRWRDSRGTQSASFMDCLGEVGQARRLRAALDASGAWLPKVLGTADSTLRLARLTHARAKAFVVCIDAAHARSVARLLTQITGEVPTLVLSDDPDSADALERFRHDTSSWAVTVKMAAEGFDCPNLRVCVYATTVISEMFFRQVVGRVVRMVDGLCYQDGAVFLPADRRLTSMVRGFLDEPGTLREPDVMREDEGSHAGALNDIEPCRFTVLSSDVTNVQVFSGDGVIAEAAIQDAQTMKADHPALAHYPDHYVAKVLSEVEAGEREFEETALARPSASLEPAVHGTSLAAGVGRRGLSTDALQRAEPDENAVVEVSVTDGGNTSNDSNGSNDSNRPNDSRIGPPRLETYDESVACLRRECRRLTSEIAAHVNASVMEIERYYRLRLGFGQTRATQAQLEYKYDILRRKADELRASED